MDSVDADPGADVDRAGRTRTYTPHVFLVAAVVLALDQASKTWALRTLTNRAPIDLIGSLRLSLQRNTGGSFSVGRSLGPVIGVLALVVVVVLAVSGRGARSRSTALVIGMLLGGALGNLLDRLLRSGVDGRHGFLHGAVVDFIDVQWWPVFNVADASVVVGAILLAVMSLRSDSGSGFGFGFGGGRDRNEASPS